MPLRFSRSPLLLISLLSTLIPAASARAYTPEMLLADNHRWPGAILEISRSGERDMHRVDAAAVAAVSREAIPKVGSVAIAPGGEVFFCSGVDGFIWKLAAGRQVVVHQHGGTVRDLAFGAQRDILFFSVVATPQNGAPLADGEVFRKNVRTGDYGRLCVVTQVDIGGDWWGSMTVHRGQLYLSTMGRASRILRLTNTGWQTAWEASGLGVHGLDFESGGDLYLVADDGKVYRSHDLRTLETVTESRSNRFSDIALLPDGASDAPGLGVEISAALLRTGDLAPRRP